MHLDVCRHFFSKEFVKKYIDQLAYYKINTFHWHLTDDQGWRIEIKKYPKLTEVGAWRTEKDGSKYGGYYTQEDIIEIVEYAKERYITITPEIEMPGHSSAALAAYPYLGCTGQQITVPNTWGIKKDIYAPTDTVFKFFEEVMDEVCALFPGRYIHIGGDEAPKTQWKSSPVAQAVMKQYNLKNEEELQHYFMHRVEKYLNSKGKIAIGWGEVVKGGLSDSMVVMSWLSKGAGIKAAKYGNDVIMAPRGYCYFDYPQEGDIAKAFWMLPLPLKKVYSFNPVPGGLLPKQQKHILGGEATLWTEYVATEAQAEHQLMPRLAALAEALWTSPSRKNYKDFTERLKAVDSK
jgi:hexosaminidase